MKLMNAASSASIWCIFYTLINSLHLVPHDAMLLFCYTIKRWCYQQWDNYAVYVKSAFQKRSAVGWRVQFIATETKSQNESKPTECGIRGRANEFH